jgi:4-amino-4-deoxy-L-arabinose transferase-like glycosyltransferase
MAFWRSPADQPGWARPALLGLAVVSGLAYGWRMGSSIEIFYAAAVRSMSMSWHDFAYAAFDPAGTVSIDKLPGAFWVQALSVRLFGVHAWSLALPQVLEGSLTVLVLYRAVRRLAGPGAGLIAAAVLAVSPATVTLNRGNISDTLLVLLLVLAADSVVAAVTAGRLRSVLMAGLWVGLAFQAKMLEAWLVVPAFALAYLIAGRANLWSRVLRQAAMVIVVIAVSLSWMLFVTLTPASHRPYVDGSQNNSVFTQVFDYNGFGRVGQPSPNAELGRTLDIPFLDAPAPSPSWRRLLIGAYGRDTGWLLPASVAVAALGLVVRRRKPRTDPLRAGIIVWGLWLLALGVVFSTSTTINAYYLAALSPAVAALLGIGAKLAWDGRHAVATRVALIFVVVGTAGYAFWLLPDAGTGLPAWLAPTVLGTGCAAGAWVAGRAVVRRARVAARELAARELAAWELAAIGVVVVLVPLVASLSVVTNTLGAFDTPFQPTAATAFTKAFFGAPLETPAGLRKIEAVRNGAPDLMATQTSVLAAPFIFATGQEVLPIGGYSGTTPEPSVGRLRALVAASAFHLVLVGPTSTDPRVEWIRRQCLKAPTPSNGAAAGVAAPPDVYYCTAPH